MLDATNTSSDWSNYHHYDVSQHVYCESTTLYIFMIYLSLFLFNFVFNSKKKTYTVLCGYYSFGVLFGVPDIKRIYNVWWHEEVLY